MNNEQKSGLLYCIGVSLLFTTLKLQGVINWPWLLVFLPLWGPPVGVGLLFLVFLFWNKRK